MTPALANRLPRAWYNDLVPAFLRTTPDTILGALTRASGDHAVEPAQTQAWLAEIALLKSWLADYREGSVFLEFTIPRMGRRIDAVLLLGELVVVIEFKVGQSRVERAALDQAWDYALDLKNFHAASHSRRIVPILVATGQRGHNVGIEDPATNLPALLEFAPDGVARAIAVPVDAMSTLLPQLQTLQTSVHDPAAAEHDAEATNLRLTSLRLDSLVDEARTRERKLICFATGVPGAGKTLVGLNLATQRRDTQATTRRCATRGHPQTMS